MNHVGEPLRFAIAGKNYKELYRSHTCKWTKCERVCECSVCQRVVCVCGCVCVRSVCLCQRVCVRV